MLQPNQNRKTLRQAHIDRRVQVSSQQLRFRGLTGSSDRDAKNRSGIEETSTG